MEPHSLAALAIRGCECRSWRDSLPDLQSLGPEPDYSGLIWTGSTRTRGTRHNPRYWFLSPPRNRHETGSSRSKRTVVEQHQRRVDRRPRRARPGAAISESRGGRRFRRLDTATALGLSFVINVIYDSSVNSAPSGFTAAIQDAVGHAEKRYHRADQGAHPCRLQRNRRAVAAIGRPGRE
jgi:hypothetical protein